MHNTNVEDIKHIVVRGTNWVGDAVMTIPALRALRRLFPNAEITLATRPWAKGMFAGVDFVDHVLVYERRSAFSVLSQAKEWRKRNFDLAVLFQNAFEASLIPFLAGVPYRLGFATEGRQFLLTHPVAVPDWQASRHEVFYYLYLIAALEHSLTGTNLASEQDPDISLSVSDFEAAQASALLRANGISEFQQVVAICPGSINSRAKRWPADRFAALADQILETGRQVVLIGSAEEKSVSDDVVSRMKHNPVVLTGKTTLEQATSVLAKVDLVVTNDTGPAHIAASLGKPTLVIFGPTNPLTTRPFSPLAEVLSHPPDCAPCMLRDCPIDHRCMTAITVAEVFEKSLTALKRGSFARTVKSVCDPVA